MADMIMPTYGAAFKVPLSASDKSKSQWARGKIRDMDDVCTMEQTNPMAVVKMTKTLNHPNPAREMAVSKSAGGGGGGGGSSLFGGVKEITDISTRINTHRLFHDALRMFH